MKKQYISQVTAFLKKYWYYLLLTAVGGISIYESCRLTAKYQPQNWLTGPSGFIMILGLALVALLLFEIITQTIRASKRAKTQKESVAVSQSQEPHPSSEEEERTPHSRNMWFSFLLLVIYTLLIKPLGFSITSALYLTANMLLLKNSWKTTLITVAVIFLFLLFGAPLMGMSFPRGLLGF